jgi:two-component system, OmpR family, sensor histidine kinase KdpD
MKHEQGVGVASMNREIRRKTPEELLREVQAEALPKTGHLKIFLGYASGVGKSFRMIDEARRRKERGQDVVVGAVQPNVPSEVQVLLDKLEVVPLKKCRDGSAMDIEAILRRRPAVCVIDGLAFNNPPGLRNSTRWQDALQLVRAGVKVIGSINIQYIEELREKVEAITGKHVTETVPTAFIRSADEIEIVDAPPEEPIERSPEQQLDADRRQERYCALREATLVLAAEVVDHQLSDYLEKHGITQHFGAQERILVCITPRANAEDMIRTARMIADRFHAEMIVACVRPPKSSSADTVALEEKLAYARSAGAQIEILDGQDPVTSILDFARSRDITQVFIGHTQMISQWPWGDPVDKLIRRSRGMDVRIFPQ